MLLWRALEMGGMADNGYFGNVGLKNPVNVLPVPSKAISEWNLSWNTQNSKYKMRILIEPLAL